VSEIKNDNRKILVGNLPISASAEELMKLFGQSAGTVVGVSVVIDARGRNTGHAFVEMGSNSEAVAAIQALSGTEMHGRTLNMSIADQPGDESKAKKRPWFKLWQ
jgi:RNA recognition motif-containing protein